ncbi:MAG: hypothetical protein EBU57_01140 [Alphaproteobacteria bacterium]|nr:hypothetical protein [Alphaproteobacteria bacterium]
MFRKTSIICLEVLFGIAVVLGILGAASAWRLSQGPVSIKFLLPYADDLLQRADSPVHADLDDLILTWAGWERALDLRALKVRLYTTDGGRGLARIREVSVTLSARALHFNLITFAITEARLLRVGKFLSLNSSRT